MRVSASPAAPPPLWAIWSLFYDVWESTDSEEKGERRYIAQGVHAPTLCMWCKRCARDAGAACYRNPLGMSRVGFGDSGRNVEVNVKRENTLRG